MIVKAVKTRKVLPKSCTLAELLDEYITELPERSVVAITSKIVSLCEGCTVPMEGIEKDDLVKQEAQYYLPRTMNPFNVTLSVTRNFLVASGGVDESNSAGQYLLWPADLQKPVNQARAFLCKKFNLKELGVIMTDSTTRPFQWGTTGLSIAYTGFEPITSYIGEPDLFGRPFEYHTNSIQNGLAAAAVLVMGEGAEQTPLAVLSDLDFVQFVDQDPTEEELAKYRIGLEDDIYAPLLKGVDWHKGQGGQTRVNKDK